MATKCSDYQEDYELVKMCIQSICVLEIPCPISRWVDEARRNL